MAKSSLSVALGRVVREARVELGLTQEELAQASGLHRNYIGGIERGERGPGLPSIYKLADGLGVQGSELLAGLEAIKDC